MMEFYYQIKGKSGEDNDLGMYGDKANWVWPPIFSGKVTANDKKEAKKIVEDEYGREFPLRVLKNMLDSNEFLLSIKEIKDDRTKSLFDIKNCKHCEAEFRVIDHYNNANTSYKGSEYCSYECKNESYQIKRYEYDMNQNMMGDKMPVIYKITNKKTKLSYIGKTTQVFTLRWYQHFYHGKGTKFHDAIKESELTDWEFNIVEVVKINRDTFKTMQEVDKHIFSREKHWIKVFDSVENGYNSKM